MEQGKYAQLPEHKKLHQLSQHKRGHHPQPMINGHPDTSKGPVIGIAAQLIDRDDPFSQSYIASSYVKFMESAGARVVPIPASMPLDELRELFPKLNGYLMPGGGARMTSSAQASYYHHSKLMVELATKQKAAGGSDFPIWGICLGFESLMTITAGDDEGVLGHSDSDDVSMSVQFKDHALESDFLRNLSKDVLHEMATKNMTYNHHGRCVTLASFQDHPLLNKFWNLLSTSVDMSEKKEVFVSAVQAKDYPIYGTQWHPEKNAFEWADLNIDHSPEAILMSQSLANFFVNKCRSSTHVFPEDELVDYIIYNYSPEYVGKHGSAFQQFYVFDY